MGCASSMDKSVVMEDNPIFSQPKEKSLNTASWIKNMNVFIHKHIEQTLDYSEHDIDIMFDTYKRFMRGAGTHNRSLNDPIHKNAIEELSSIIDNNKSHQFIGTHMSHLISAYAFSGRRAEFEEIAIIFSIIVNAPVIRRCEIPW